MPPIAPAAGRIRRATGPWRPARLRRGVAFLLAGLPLQAAALAVFATSGMAVAKVLHSGRLLPGMGHAHKSVALLTGVLAGAAVLMAVAGVFTGLQRRRFRRFLGVTIPATPAADPLTRKDFTRSVRSLAATKVLARQVVAPARWAAAWRRLCYHLLAGPVAGVAAVLALGAGVAGVALAAVYSYPHLKMLKGGQWELTSLTVAGALLLLSTPWLIAAAARLDAWAGAALLGPGRAGALAHRVEVLTQSRAGVVDAADAERRRLERDLHDGAQQRLVSLAMNLGIARATLAGLPDDARKVIVQAHDEAKEALAELRNLVRGLHPAILEDRGLDAALSGIAARAPFPVRVRVDVPNRPTPTVEAIAYFVVSEALANITKHARAGRAEVAVNRTGDILRVSVADDGVGGADPGRGTGLAGLARRAGSVDGSFSLSSPAGGPTEIVVELPCAP
jgi:signal transduction histidine kinase